MRSGRLLMIYRTISPILHHYLVQYHVFKPFISEDQIHKYDGEKYSYISSFIPNNENLHELKEQIKRHMVLYDHVYVNFAEPGIMYKDISNPLYPDGDYHTTIDFVNQFKESDNVTFFANLVARRHTNRPIHFVNDMFFQSNKIYQEYDICKGVLSKLIPNRSKKPLHWEAMFSRHVDQYKYFETLDIFNDTLSTCWPLGKYFFSRNVPAFKDTPADDIGIDNLRVSDIIDPDIYNQTYYSLVFETVRHNDFAMFSEKEAKPMMAKRPFIIFGSCGHMEAFRSLGFKTFSPVIDESYDQIQDQDLRFKKVCESMAKLSEQDPLEVYDKLEEVLEHNRQHFLYNKWNKEFLDCWHQGQKIDSVGRLIS